MLNAASGKFNVLNGFYLLNGAFGKCGNFTVRKSTVCMLITDPEVGGDTYIAAA